MSDEKIIELPATGFAPSNALIADRLRQWADIIQQSAVPIRTGIILLENDRNGIERTVIGHPCDQARLVGLLTTATHKAIIGE